ncbi:MAG: FAD-dependent oxidoreductase [Lachnospiraceae bacterium]|nr:FAD-dependent oxidoreductase [Lachnospiraceae bacterium]
MSRLRISTPDEAQLTIEQLYLDLERHITASPPGLCPVDMQISFLRLCHAQSCGKCVPCRVGLGQLQRLMTDVLEGRGTEETLELIRSTAESIEISADCAIGYDAARMVLNGLKGCRDDYLSHIRNGRCAYGITQPVPCRALCPAGVDVPGYIALVGEGRYADAVRLIRKDNPFPTACALVCEHPCEARCRRNMIDSAVNIRALKRMAVDHARADTVLVPANQPATDRAVAIVGGGPSGLSAAYYLALMGHRVDLYEEKPHLGGMLRYGIPPYRFPRERLQEDIDAILSTRIRVHRNVKVGSDITIRELHDSFDAVYIAIGAQTNKEAGIEAGENIRRDTVLSAVEMLRNVGMEIPMDFEGKRVVIIGGGNVAMDCTRTAIRLGAKKVTVAYRRRRGDMTALPEEVEGAIAEGAELVTLAAPVRLETGEDGSVEAVIVQPQISGAMDAQGRPRPVPAAQEPVRIPCDLVVTAIGQGIETQHFEEFGLSVRQGIMQAVDDSLEGDVPGVFVGGDCVTGPATVIQAIAAGKVAAANIDEYLGFHHSIGCDVEIPPANLADRKPCGRINLREAGTGERRNNFEQIEMGMTEEEARQEAGRCLRCDHFGYGILKGGRENRW